MGLHPFGTTCYSWTQACTSIQWRTGDHDAILTQQCATIWHQRDPAPQRCATEPKTIHPQDNEACLYDDSYLLFDIANTITLINVNDQPIRSLINYYIRTRAWVHAKRNEKGNAPQNCWKTCEPTRSGETVTYIMQS